MAEAQDDLMKVGELKTVLALADKQPINCAFGLAADKSALLLVHKQTAPKILVKQVELKAKSADKNSLRFGRITVDAADPGTLKFTTNKKEIGGTVMGLVKLAKKAGYQAVVLNEDPALEGGDAPAGTSAAAAGAGAGRSAAAPAAAGAATGAANAAARRRRAAAGRSATAAAAAGARAGGSATAAGGAATGRSATAAAAGGAAAGRSASAAAPSSVGRATAATAARLGRAEQRR